MRLRVVMGLDSDSDTASISRVNRPVAESGPSIGSRVGCESS